MPVALGILASATILPPWLVLPLAIPTMLVIAAHVLAVHQSDHPLKRRRIRVVNGLLMLLITALLAYALGMAEVVNVPAQDPSGARRFLVIWLSIVGLVGIVVALAGADAAHTLLAGLKVRRQLRGEMRRQLAGDLARRRSNTARTAVAPAQDSPRGS